MQTSMLLFMNIGTPELLVVLFAVLLLFGGKKLPELARGLGKGIREFKDASDDVKREIHRNINAVQEDLHVDLEETASSPMEKDYYPDSDLDTDTESKKEENQTSETNQAQTT